MRSASDARLSYESFDEEEICGGTIDAINSNLLRRNRDELRQDSILNRLCESAVEKFSKSRFVYRKKLKKELASIDYALRLSGASNRMLLTYCFRVDLLDLVPGASFYCNKREKTSAIHLYEGKAPKIRNKEHPDYKDPVPLKTKTVRQTVDEIMRVFTSKNGMREVNSRKYTQVGLACRLDDRTLNQSKRPTLYFSIMLAGKQMQQVKKKDVTERIMRYDE
ncbi:MAG: hypothetical protein ABJG99_03910 [Crocinitomicaceae bacterium]